MPDRSAAGPGIAPALARFLGLFAAVALAHLTLLRLPYFWDEGGYYVPAALDFYHRWTLIPEFTNAHPPLPNVVLGLLWHVFGFHILVTRLTACAFAAAGLLAVYHLGRLLLGAAAAIAVTALTAVYPIWFTQSSLAHADIFAAAFTLWGVALYLTSPEFTEKGGAADTLKRRRLLTGLLFCGAVLAKETALLQPVVLACVEAFAAMRGRNQADRRQHLRWLGPLCAPVPLLAAWYGFHWLRTGFIFGNPTFLHYNATGNLTPAHVFRSLAYRFLHLFWQREMIVAVVLALACLFLPTCRDAATPVLSRRVLGVSLALLVANWVAFSILGGALLTRYLLPAYPLLLLLCVASWQRHTRRWPILAVVTGAAFVCAWWLSPPSMYAPEDNLTYRDMIVVHQEAIAYLEQHLPHATVLTAWPAAAELYRPELGYTRTPFQVCPIEDFSAAQIALAAGEPGRCNTALVFTTHYATPAYRRYLIDHPASRRGRAFAEIRDLSPGEIARVLGGRVVWEDDRHGEWAAILRLPHEGQAPVSGPPGTSRQGAQTSGLR